MHCVGAIVLFEVYKGITHGANRFALYEIYREYRLKIQTALGVLDAVSQRVTVGRM